MEATKPYRVVVDAEYESKWYLEPQAFPTRHEAVRYAAGIAKWWAGQDGAPSTIWIKGPDFQFPQSVGGLLTIGWWLRWFDD